MKLYRVRIDPTETNTWCRETCFKTSMIEAKKVASANTKHRVAIDKCYVLAQLNATDWIELLNFDAPGRQEGKTPIDFITSTKTVWMNKKLKAYKQELSA